MRVGKDTIDRGTVVRLVGEKAARRMGLEGAEISVDYVEDGDYRLSLIKEGECKGILWVNPESGKVWGFGLEGSTPTGTVQIHMSEFVDLMGRLIE